VVDPDDFDELVGAVTALLSDPERRQAMGRAARQWCTENFSLEVVAAHWRDALLPLLAAR
jgi:glycosyltransferase involved in cell wall biosynthesis